MKQFGKRLKPFPTRSKSVWRKATKNEFGKMKTEFEHLSRKTQHSSSHRGACRVIENF